MSFETLKWAEEWSTETTEWNIDSPETEEPHDDVFLQTMTQTGNVNESYQVGIIGAASAIAISVIGYCAVKRNQVKHVPDNFHRV